MLESIEKKEIFIFNLTFLAAACLNIVTQSTKGSIKTYLSPQVLKMNSNPTFCISCLQEGGKRFLGSSGKKSHNFSQFILIDWEKSSFYGIFNSCKKTILFKLLDM